MISTLLSSVYNMRSKVGLRSKSKKLTNHSQLFFLHSTVIGQFLTFTS